jgi:hypothetical protein
LSAPKQAHKRWLLTMKCSISRHNILSMVTAKIKYTFTRKKK